MARLWKDVRRRATDAGLVDEQRVSQEREHQTGQVRAQRLAEIRRSHHVTQQELAAGMKVSQARISTIERGELSHAELATIQSYVEGLGGRLRGVAEFGDESLVVRD